MHTDPVWILFAWENHYGSINLPKWAWEASFGKVKMDIWEISKEPTNTTDLRAYMLQQSRRTDWYKEIKESDKGPSLQWNVRSSAASE